MILYCGFLFFCVLNAFEDFSQNNIQNIYCRLLAFVLLNSLSEVILDRPDK